MILAYVLTQQYIYCFGCDHREEPAWNVEMFVQKFSDFRVLYTEKQTVIAFVS
jgi:hypothetical protein